MLVSVPLILFLCAYYQISQTALLTFLAAVVALIPFFLRFEQKKPKPRDIMPIVVLAAIAAAGRILFAPFPDVKPVSAVIIVSSMAFGRESGFLTGALAALSSNLFFGQGPWTPWQMYAWGLIGYVAGCIQDRGWFEKRPVIYVYGFLSAFLYGVIMDSWHVIGYVTPLTWQGALAAYAAGFPFNLTHAVATVVFLVPICKPWGKKLERIKRKYGITEAKSIRQLNPPVRPERSGDTR